MYVVDTSMEGGYLEALRHAWRRSSGKVGEETFETILEKKSVGIREKTVI